MSRKEYMETLNSEIQKLNGIIDLKIFSDRDYKREARRHKALLTKLRREEARRLFVRSWRAAMPAWR